MIEQTRRQQIHEIKALLMRMHESAIRARDNVSSRGNADRDVIEQLVAEANRYADMANAMRWVVDRLDECTEATVEV